MTVDGLKYHVDVTWDDVVPDVLGRVHHNYLLKSTSCLLNDSSHSASDFTDTSPVSTAYDNWLLNNSLSNAVFINGRLFFINNADKTLREYFPNGGVSVIKNLNPNWGDGSISFPAARPIIPLPVSRMTAICSFIRSPTVFTLTTRQTELFQKFIPLLFQGRR